MRDVSVTIDTYFRLIGLPTYCTCLAGLSSPISPYISPISPRYCICLVGLSVASEAVTRTRTRT